MDAKPSGNVSFPTYKDKNWTSIRILLLSKGGKCRSLGPGPLILVFVLRLLEKGQTSCS